MAVQAIKTRSSKSRKIEIFPKGFVPGLCSKLAFFLSFYFQSIQARKMCFMIFQSGKTPFQAIKSRCLKSRKIEIFPKGLVHGFGPKLVFFPSFYFRQYRQENVFQDILEGKSAFLAYKNKKFKKSKKLRFFQRGSSLVYVQNQPFLCLFIFRQYRPGRCVSRYSERKKRLSRLYKNRKFKKSKN